MKGEFLKYLNSLKVKSGVNVSLKKDFCTDYNKKIFTKEEGESLLAEGISNMAKMQDKLYANDKYSVLIILQAMDAAGKDGAIKHVMSGLNPQGVKVNSFKTPSKEELNHDYLWRHYKELPPRGDIGIFNRSHYENVLITKVHPEFILNEKLPGINSVKDIDKKFWEKRYKQINRFEKTLAENGTIIMKFFLHVSKDIQKNRFLERINDPSKNWKFSVADAAERKHWNEYQKAYEELLSATSTDYAPWFVLPADDKWFTRLCLSYILHNEFESLKLKYPTISESQKIQLQKTKQELMKEK